MRSYVSLILLAASLGLAAPAHAATDPLAGLRSHCALKRSPDRKPHLSVRYKLCSGKVASFDGTPLDVTLTLPARLPRGRRRLPLVVFLHGFLSSKAEYLSETRTGVGLDRGADAYKTIDWNNIWFASRGYATLNYTARGHGDSGGQIGLASKNIEVRDTHHLTGVLTDEGARRRPLVRIAPKKIGVIGGSYGGGQTWLLLTTRGAGVKQYGSWRSPQGRLLSLGAVAPGFTWTDLLYSLVPNGHHRTDRLVDPARDDLPTGIGKQTLVDGFLATGNSKLTPEVLRWLTRLNAGEPYDNPSDPVIPEARHALTVDRSPYFQNGYFAALRAHRQRRVPVLAAQGWTDPIFEAIEPVRMYRRLQTSSTRYPIELYFGDFEHLTSLAKVSEFARWHDLGNRLFDRYLLGRRRKVRFDARSTETDCNPNRLGPFTAARSWSGLARHRLTLPLGGPRQTASPLPSSQGSSVDPVVQGTARGRGCLTRAGADPTPGLASYTVSVPANTTLLGLPRLKVRFRTVATDLELNSRLWDVAPDGGQTLVTRGAYRAISPGLGATTIEYELFGNHWRFAPGHRLLLEVLQDDSTYLRRDNFASSATLDDVTLVLPTR
jgi:ABC-2 type transport system ATP-binding protein